MFAEGVTTISVYLQLHVIVVRLVEGKIWLVISPFYWKGANVGNWVYGRIEKEDDTEAVVSATSRVEDDPLLGLVPGRTKHCFERLCIGYVPTVPSADTISLKGE